MRPTPLCLFAALAFAGAALISAAPAHAQASLSFSGGNGSPLSITLLAPITYTVTTAGGVRNFVFKGLSADLDRFSFTSLSGTMAYRINNGAALSFTNINDGASSPDGALAIADAYVFGQNTTQAQVGDTVTLLSGTLTTSGILNTPAPVSGSYATYVGASGSASRLTNNGTLAAAVPEPGSAALALPILAGMGIVVTARARRRRA